MKSLNIYVINNSHITKNDMSGGEKIAMELACRWTGKSEIYLYTSNLGACIWNNYGIINIRKIEFIKAKENLLDYFRRAILGSLKFGRIKLDQHYKNIIYSSSDFWPDSIPAFILKLRNPKAKWIAGFYLFAPKPWQKDSPYKGKRWFIGLFYWLTQLPIYWLVKRFADMVFVTSKPDVEKFITKRRNRDKILVIRGGVDTKPSEEYLNSGRTIPLEKRKYDGCFIGRFHPQKGVLELIDIWKLVCAEKPNAKLAMIGNGPLEKEVKEKIEKLFLKNNIELLGFKDGEEKYEIFKQSKIILHPAIYDSGGMAAAEGMAWGLPGVSFDLEALKTYYPKGMLKTKCFDFQDFANNIIELLVNKELYNKLSKDSLDLTREEWDWRKRAEVIYDCIIRNTGEK